MKLLVLRIYLRLLGIISPNFAAKQAVNILFTPFPTNKRSQVPEPDEVLRLNEDTVVKVWRGHGQTVLLMHGWSGAVEQFSVLLSKLLSRGYRVVAPIPKGHHWDRPEQSHPGLFIQAVHDVVNKLGIPIDVAVGHSMGASAIALALSESCLYRKLVMIGSPADFTLVLNRFANALKLSTKVKQHFFEKVDNTVGIPHAQLDVAKTLAKHPVRSLIIHDHFDKEVPFFSAFMIKNASHDATVLATRKLGHRRILDSKEVNQAIAAFIDNQPIITQQALEKTPVIPSFNP